MSQTSTEQQRDFSWAFWPLLPIYPYGQRRTLRQEVITDTIWTFEQVQGIFYVVVPIRMTVVRLNNGGLLVYAPIAPTPECIRLMRELEQEYGLVKYIILPTISGLEHKVFVGPFARQFPQAQVWVAPHQWSFPVNLPLSWLGFPKKRTFVLPNDASQTPFRDEFDYQILGPIYLGPGSFEEVAFYHLRSQTLLLTDTIVSIPEDPPAICQLDSYPLLFHAKDAPSDVISDDYLNRRKGWQRICLFAFYFSPSVLDITKLGQAWQEAKNSRDRTSKAYFGLYPFKWRDNWQQSFSALRNNGKILVAPILQTLILNRAPKETIYWANQVVQWQFKRIIPCHLDAPITADSYQFRQAFNFLETISELNLSDSLPQADLSFLRELDQGLTNKGITPPPKAKI